MGWVCNAHHPYNLLATLEGTAILVTRTVSSPTSQRNRTPPHPPTKTPRRKNTVERKRARGQNVHTRAKHRDKTRQNDTRNRTVERAAREKHTEKSETQTEKPRRSDKNMQRRQGLLVQPVKATRETRETKTLGSKRKPKRRDQNMQEKQRLLSTTGRQEKQTSDEEGGNTEAIKNGRRAQTHNGKRWLEDNSACGGVKQSAWRIKGGKREGESSNRLEETRHWAW